MIYNEAVIGEHPAQSGYRLEFFVQGEDTPDFQSGSGSFTVNFPKFAITGIQFQGKEQAQLPTGDGLQLIEDYDILTNTINLVCFFSGDLNGTTGLATRNIKQLAIFTGASTTFTPDIINETNLIAKSLAQVDENAESFTFSVSSEDIEDRVEENISYKVMPLDFLTFGNVSQGVSGIMFSGFQDVSNINVTEYIISRDNIRDIELSEYGGAIDIFTGCNIIIDDGLVLDLDIDFRVRTDTEPITISGSGGAILRSSSSEFTVSSNSITLPAGNDLAEFNLSSLLDADGNREAFIISES